MNSSRALLRVCDGAVERAFAASPQRWNRPIAAADGYVEVVHQLTGDGLFGGDTHRTAIEASGPGTRLVVRGISATPLRPGGAASVVARLTVRQDAALLYFPGALLPHEGSESSHSLRIAVEPGAGVLAAAVVLPGRTGRGEFAAFRSLRLRTVVLVLGGDGEGETELGLPHSSPALLPRGGRREAGVTGYGTLPGGEGEAPSGAFKATTFAEDALVTPARWLSGAAGFAGAGAAFTILAAGALAAAEPGWWRCFEDARPPGEEERLAWGASPLSGGGVIVRGLAATYGDAAAFLECIERAARSA